MPTQKIFDTVSETTGNRLPVEKEGARTTFNYSSGAEIVTEVTERGDGRNGREVRTIVSARGPRRYFVGGFGPGKLKKPYRVLEEHSGD